MTLLDSMIDQARLEGRVDPVIRDGIVQYYSGIVRAMTVKSSYDHGLVRRITGLALITRATVSVVRHGIWEAMPKVLGLETLPDGSMLMPSGDIVGAALSGVLGKERIDLEGVIAAEVTHPYYLVATIEAMVRYAADERIAPGSTLAAPGFTAVGAIGYVDAGMELANGASQDELAIAVSVGLMEGMHGKAPARD